MDDATLLDRLWNGMRATFAVLAQGAPDNRLVDLDGVVALVVPATPERSVLNSVVYEDPDRLHEVLGDLEALYGDAGVRAWTVWVHPSDRATAHLLERAGHRLDATPMGMGRALEGVTPVLPPGVEWTRGGGVTDLTRLNDAAYGWEESRPWTRALAGMPAEQVEIYLASVDGRPACALMTHDAGGDCAIWLVATLAAARGRGLAAGLLAQALVDARDRGCTSTTLQATKLGEPVYARLGYRPLGTLEMWERREPEPTG